MEYKTYKVKRMGDDLYVLIRFGMNAHTLKRVSENFSNNPEVKAVDADISWAGKVDISKLTLFKVGDIVSPRLERSVYANLTLNLEQLYKVAEINRIEGDAILLKIKDLKTNTLYFVYDTDILLADNKEYSYEIY